MVHKISFMYKIVTEIKNFTSYCVLTLKHMDLIVSVTASV